MIFILLLIKTAANKYVLQFLHKRELFFYVLKY